MAVAASGPLRPPPSLPQPHPPSRLFERREPSAETVGPPDPLPAETLNFSCMLFVILVLAVRLDHSAFVLSSCRPRARHLPQS